MSLTDIPQEVVKNEIMTFLQVGDLVHFCLTTNEYYKEFDDYMWNYLLQRDFQYKETVPDPLCEYKYNFNALIEYQTFRSRKELVWKPRVGNKVILWMDCPAQIWSVKATVVKITRVRNFVCTAVVKTENGNQTLVFHRKYGWLKKDGAIWWQFDRICNWMSPFETITHK